MSNPCINRWGLNTFWHNYWYSDSNYAKNLQIDSISKLLLKTYFTHGIYNKINFFWNLHWFKNTPNLKSNKPLRYYRWRKLAFKVVKAFTTYRFRVKFAERFDTKWTILKWSNFLVINVHWFRPRKTGKRGLTRFKYRPLRLPTAGLRLNPMFKRVSYLLQYSYMKNLIKITKRSLKSLTCIE